MREVVALAAVGGDELARLHEHAARAAARVEHATLVRLEHLDEQPDDRARRVELAGVAALGRGELAEEVLVDPAEHVVGAVVVGLGEADGADQVDELTEEALVDLLAGVGLGQHALEGGVLLLDEVHRGVEQDADLGCLACDWRYSHRAPSGTQKTFSDVYSSRTRRSRRGGPGSG